MATETESADYIEFIHPDEKDNSKTEEYVALKYLNFGLGNISPENLEIERNSRAVFSQNEATSHITDAQLLEETKKFYQEGLLEVLQRVTENWQNPSAVDVRMSSGEVLTNTPGLTSGKMGELVAHLVGAGILEDFPEFEETAISEDRETGFFIDADKQKAIAIVRFIMVPPGNTYEQKYVYAKYTFNMDVAAINAAMKRLYPDENI